MSDKTETVGASMTKLFGIGLGAIGAWTLQDWSLVVAIASGLVAAVSGVIYSIKMLIEIYWLNRIRRTEANRLEKESQ